MAVTAQPIARIVLEELVAAVMAAMKPGAALRLSTVAAAAAVAAIIIRLRLTPAMRIDTMTVVPATKALCICSSQLNN